MATSPPVWQPPDAIRSFRMTGSEMCHGVSADWRRIDAGVDDAPRPFLSCADERPFRPGSVGWLVEEIVEGCRDGFGLVEMWDVPGVWDDGDARVWAFGW